MGIDDGTASSRSRRVDAIAAAHDDVRAAVGVSQQAALSVKRELERIAVRGLTPEPGGAPAVTAPAARPTPSRRLDAYKYVGFEDQFRGSQDAIRSRLESYLPFFAGRASCSTSAAAAASSSICSRRGIAARGIDLNPEMVESLPGARSRRGRGRRRGYLATADDGSLGGIFAAQVVEHLEPGYLLRFLELAIHKLRPGGTLVLETLNPACWVAFFESYIRDITHVRPLHPETLKYLVMASGFRGGDRVPIAGARSRIGCSASPRRPDADLPPPTSSRRSTRTSRSSTRACSRTSTTRSSDGNNPTD